MRLDLSRHRDRLPLAAVVFASFVLHYIYRLRWVGEQDLARLITEATTWHETGAFPSGTYTSRTSPLYLLLIRGLYAAGNGFDRITATLGYINIIAGSLVAIPLFLLWRRLSSDAAALCGVLVLQFIPSLWVGSLYGMPHVPAFFLATIAFALYARALEEPAPKVSPRHLALAAVCMIVATALKADIVLITGSFLGIAFCMKRLDRRALAAAVGIPALGLCVTMLLTRTVLPPVITQAWQAGEFREKFPAKFEYFLGDENIGTIVDSVGPWMLLAAFASGVFLIYKGRLRREVLLVLVWCLPAHVFWGPRLGNAARHVMASMVPLAWMIGAAVVEFFESRELRTIAIVCILQFNYTSRPGSDSVRQPSARLIDSARQINDLAGNLQQGARRAAADPAPKKVYVGYAELAYYVFESQRIAKSFSYRRDPNDPYGGEELIIVRQGGMQQTIHTLDPDDRRHDGSKYKEWTIWQNGRRIQAGAPPSSGG